MAGFSPPQITFFYQGTVAAAGSVNVYQTGTTTLVSLFSDSALTQSIANPVTLDASGQCKFYVGSSINLRMDAYTANATFIESLDPVFVLPNLGGLTATGAQLNFLSGVTAGTAANSKALVLDSSGNITGLNTLAGNTASTGIANMTAVQNSLFGGFINKFRNPSFDVQQRGGSGSTSSSAGVYCYDGWIVGSDGTRTVTWTDGGPTAWSNAGIAISAHALKITGAASLTDCFIKQRIESSIAAHFAAKQVTVQIILQNLLISGSIIPTLTVKHPTAIDNWAATTTDINGVSMQTVTNGTTAVIAYTFPMSNLSDNGVEITFDFGSALNNASSSIIFGYADIRETPGVSSGINNSPPVTTEKRPIHAEMVFCQRYLAAFGDIFGIIGSGGATSTSASGYFIPFKVPMRIAPTGLSITTVGNLEVADFAGTDIAALTGITYINKTSPQGAFVTATVAGTPFTSGSPYALYAKTALAGNLLFTGAEL